MPRAYSYLRFSTPEQMRGDSFRRQAALAAEYAARHGLDLDDKLTFRDLGVSAFRGANAAEGQLGIFLAAVKSGKVAPGSYLLVESLDRISRQAARKALRVLESIVESGVALVTLGDGKVYTAETLDGDPMALVLAVLTFIRANEESATKSRRVRAAWQNKRDRASAGHKLTAKAPAWLRLRDGAFEVIPERAALVHRMFAMTLAGHGKVTVARTFNAEKLPAWGDGPTGARKANGWHPSYVQKVLRNEAVIGRYQPMRRLWGEDGKKRREPIGAPVDNYFPVILDDPGDFYRVRRGVSGHGAAPPANALSGLAQCGACGGPLHFVNKGAPPKGGSYLACDNARRKKSCDARSVRYAVVLEALLLALEDGEINLRKLAGNGRAERQQALAHQLAAVEGQTAETEGAVSRLLDVLQRQSASVAIEARLIEQEATLANLRERKAQLERDTRAVAAEAGGEDAAGDVLQVAAEARRGGADTVVRLNAALKRLADRVQIGFSTEAADWMAAGLAWADRHTGGKPFPDDLTARTYRAIMADATVSVAVVFRATGRHLVICADPRRMGRFVAGAVQETGGAVEEFTLKVWAVS